MSGGSKGGGEEWIVDTAAVVILAKAGQLDLLTDLAGTVFRERKLLNETAAGMREAWP